MIFILALFLLTPVTAQNSENTVKLAALEDDISVHDLREWYSCYRGVYLWGKELDFIECNDTQVVFDRILLVMKKIQPSKNASKMAVVIDGIFSKHKETNFDYEGKQRLLEDLNYVSEGIRMALERE